MRQTQTRPSLQPLTKPIRYWRLGIDTTDLLTEWLISCTCLIGHQGLALPQPLGLPETQKEKINSRSLPSTKQASPLVFYLVVGFFSHWSYLEVSWANQNYLNTFGCKYRDQAKQIPPQLQAFLKDSCTNRLLDDRRLGLCWVGEAGLLSEISREQIAM